MNYLHPPDDCIDPLWAGLHGRLQVVGGEGDVTHASVALQRIRDVLVTLRTENQYHLFPRSEKRPVD